MFPDARGQNHAARCGGGDGGGRASAEWTYTRREKVFRTEEGTRKPDLIVSKGDRSHVLDVQIISGSRPLSEGHRRKRDYYSSNGELMGAVARLLQVPQKKIKVSTVTLSWRGVWASE